MWRLFEPLHAVVYFAREKKDVYDRAGLRGGWMGYFASRCAAMGPIGPEVAIAVLYNFHPDMVRRAIPDAWSYSSPDRVLEARFEVADAALRRAWGADGDSSSVASAVTSVRRALGACVPEGRPLFAAHLSLDWPSEPHLALWHGCTLLREHRGDGHVASLVAAGVDGCEAHVLQTAAGRITEDDLRPHRGWSEAEWADARQRLSERGLLDDDGALSNRGAELLSEVDSTTDRTALAPWREIGEENTSELARILSTLVRPILDREVVPYPNPMGVPPPPPSVPSGG